jgi:NADPH-dependent F420 reductase
VAPHVGSSGSLSAGEEGEVKVTIIGAGNMARAIATRVLAGGNEVELIGRNQAAVEALADELGASVGGDVSGEAVVLAVPYDAAADVVAEHRDELRGRVVVDITNPVDWSTFEGLVTPSDSSAAEEIAKLLPEGTPVVKAFNTAFAATLSAGQAGGQPFDVLLAGDDADAKKTVASLVEAGGLRPLDVGPLRRARQLEQMGFLHIAAQEPLGAGFSSGITFRW